MKRIKVNGPVVFKMAGKDMLFRPGQSYDVRDDVANHPWLSNQISERVDLEPDLPAEPEQTGEPEQTAEPVQEPESDQAPDKQETKRARTKRISKPVSDVSS